MVAQRRGLQVTDITLWVFGGVARIGGEARTPRDDFAIAVVGPLASFTISVLASMLLLGMYLLGVPGIVVASVAWLSSMNFILAVFNLAPAAPLDGGRLLRAWLWHRSGDHDAAARKATRAGEVLAWLLVVSGLVELALGALVEGVWMLVLGWVVRNAARSEARQVGPGSGAVPSRQRPFGPARDEEAHDRRRDLDEHGEGQRRDELAMTAGRQDVEPRVAHEQGRGADRHALEPR